MYGISSRGRAAALAALLASALPGLHAAPLHDAAEARQTARRVAVANGELLAALRRYEAAAQGARDVELARLNAVAVQRRADLEALAANDPRQAAEQLLSPAVRARLPASAQAAAERDVVVVGRIAASVADDIERGLSRLQLEIVDADGRRRGLAVADASERDRLAMVGRRAAVTGVQIGNTVLVTERRHLELLAAAGDTSSTPVAAVTWGGRPSVSSASSRATSGMRQADTTPCFTVAPVVTMEMGVTSEPVPAVVGIRISGSRGPLARPIP